MLPAPALPRLEKLAALDAAVLCVGLSSQDHSPYVFITEAGTPITTAWFLRMVQRTGRAAKLPFQVHPHMLRHSTGYKLANQDEDTRSLTHYLGHRNLQSTARYTALAPDRFKGGWQDLTRKPVLLGRRAMRPYSATWLICGDKP